MSKVKSIDKAKQREKLPEIHLIESKWMEKIEVRKFFGEDYIQEEFPILQQTKLPLEKVLPHILDIVDGLANPIALRGQFPDDAYDFSVKDRKFTLKMNSASLGIQLANIGSTLNDMVMPQYHILIRDCKGQHSTIKKILKALYRSRQKGAEGTHYILIYTPLPEPIDTFVCKTAPLWLAEYIGDYWTIDRS